MPWRCRRSPRSEAELRPPARAIENYLSPKGADANPPASAVPETQVSLEASGVEVVDFDKREASYWLRVGDWSGMAARIAVDNATERVVSQIAVLGRDGSSTRWR